MFAGRWVGAGLVLTPDLESTGLWTVGWAGLVKGGRIMTSYLTRGITRACISLTSSMFSLTVSLFSTDRSRVPGQVSEGHLAQGFAYKAETV